jgi:hypothetical protein
MDKHDASILNAITMHTIAVACGPGWTHALRYRLLREGAFRAELGSKLRRGVYFGFLVGAREGTHLSWSTSARDTFDLISIEDISQLHWKDPES